MAPMGYSRVRGKLILKNTWNWKSRVILPLTFILVTTGTALISFFYPSVPKMLCTQYLTTFNKKIQYSPHPSCTLYNVYCNTSSKNNEQHWNSSAVFWIKSGKENFLGRYCTTFCRHCTESCKMANLLVLGRNSLSPSFLKILDNLSI